MGKWDKLNKELDDVLARLTDEDWDKWYANQRQNQLSRREVENKSRLWEAVQHYCNEAHNAVVYRWDQNLPFNQKITAPNSLEPFFLLNSHYE